MPALPLNGTLLFAFIVAKESEMQDLAALESLLAKAQKTRDIQTKVCRNQEFQCQN